MNSSRRIRLEGKEYHAGNIRSFTEKISHSDWGKDLAQFITEWLDDSTEIVVQTSGSTGLPKQIRLPKKMMTESALMTGRFLDLKTEDKALLCLPARYIAGKMMVVRAFTLGLDLYSVPPASIPEIEMDFEFTAMTPHQTSSIMHNQKEKLNRISKLIIGGGSIDDTLRDQLQSVDAQCFLSYGMTETSSHIALQKINGPDKSERFELIDDRIRLILEEDGRLSITGGLLGKELVRTNDLVKMIGQHAFQWLGRADFVINTGGIKVHPEVLENKIKDLIPVAFLITGIADPIYQQRIVLVLEPGIDKPQLLIDNILTRVLPHEKPVKMFEINALPKTENGKIIRNINFETDVKLIWEKSS